ncbi:hypothetical protein QBC47DRAFT_411421 [Echria macrotheca]|uniref:DUF7907 domain-containing protein n=1 Tax=Echria macrotheca TaxID=438768 RepID=A0AAJ0BFF5_9PEZI|nr:hypothetical protein QBC47DRAFT_411421 [Echria macrotheca]
MRSLLTFISLVSLCFGAPAKRQTPSPKKPSESLGFMLIAKVDASKDMNPSIHNWVFSTIHVGAAQNVAVLTAPSTKSPGRVFYENGTAEQVASGETTIITDGASPPAPFGVTIQGPRQFDQTYPKEHSIYVNAGPGSFASIGGSAAWYPTLRNWQDEGAGTFAACNNMVPYYGDTNRFITVQYVYGGEEVPTDCVPVTLVAQCADLDELPADAWASHQFAVEVRCYQEVSKMEIS